MMGAIAAELADEIVLTDDNPRTEDPARIIEQIAAGIDTDVPVRTIRAAGCAPSPPRWPKRVQPTSC